MIYPKDFEQKIGFADIRRKLKGNSLSTLGSERVDDIMFSDDADTINEGLMQVREFRRIEDECDDFPLQYFFDMRTSLARIRLENTHLEEGELFDLCRSLGTINDIVIFLRKKDDDTLHYPTLARLTKDVITFPKLISQIRSLLDRYGKICDNASTQLAEIRRNIRATEGSVSRTLFNILRAAQNEGIVEKDISPTLRDGRLVIPVLPAMKRKIRGIVHDESASGRTIYIEPAEVVEANNRIRELEAAERREIIRILTEFTKQIRPHVSDILNSYRLLADIDLIRAKSQLAREMKAIEPTVEKESVIDWIGAIHPLLQTSLEKQGKTCVPLEITLTDEKRLLIISGPNAGGKSVCLKTVGLLQYMLQCGISIPINEHSRTGVFENIMIDIGDEQSIENDLSTYSSHLVNMKQMIKHSNKRTLLLIDEMGTGTEPQIGGAIAESVLKQFCKNKTFGIITTHYQNLKHFADSQEGVINGAMLYDRQEMQPLFKLSIGQPGSSFAIEIARKIGLPQEVIKDASEIVGSDYIQSDKYLQDIVRDKRYWESKRQTVHQREKDIEKIIAKYEQNIAEIEQKRKDILRHAKEQADELLNESNRKIENAIREIRESQAEKEETRRIREDLNAFKEEVSNIDSRANDEMIAKKIAQIQQRKERKAKRKAEKAKKEEQQKAEIQAKPKKEKEQEFNIGDTVRIKGLSSIGKIEKIDGKMASVIFGDMRTTMRLERLEHAKESEGKKDEKITVNAFNLNQTTRNTIDEHRNQFHQDLDVRGMRGDEALNAVMYFIDDAILVGMSRVRILHGKGNGILRQLIRQYLATVPNVTHFADEHVQFGGAGITVVDL